MDAENRLAFSADVGFLENILHIIFVEIMSFDRYGTVCLRIVINIMVSTMTF